MRLAKLVLFLLPALLTAQTHPNWCEADAQTRQQLKQVHSLQPQDGDRRTAQLKRLDELLAQSPDNLDYHLRYQELACRDSPNGRQNAVSRYQQLAEAHSNDPAYQYLYASVLVDTDTSKAIQIANQLLQTAPDFPRTHLLLANVYEWGKFADKAKAEAETAAFFQQCPASLNSAALSAATTIKAPAILTKITEQLSARLDKTTDPDELEHWQTVWNLEFKAHPPTEHPRIRQQIANKLAQLTAVHPDGDARWLSFLRESYKLAGNTAMEQKEKQKLLAEYPQSEEAQVIVNEEWYKQHPWPGPDVAKQKPYNLASLQHANEMLKTAPHSALYLWTRFNALSQLDDTPNDQLTAAADAFLAQYRKTHDIMFSPPPQLQIAQAYVKRKIRVDQVPQLVQEALEDAATFNGPLSDRMPDKFRKSEEQFHDYLTCEAASTLVDAAQQLHRPEIAQGMITKVEQLKLDEPSQKVAQFQAEAKWAELQNHKLDALLFYRAALDVRPARAKPIGKDELADNVAHLRQELGGTAATETLWEPKPKTEQAAQEGAWKRPDKEMKPWQLTDLQGKTWKLTQLEGKTTLINVWSTWCGPCKAEHPHLQKLYDQLKNDPNVQILTFNVDEEVGNVEPYMKENSYTFPVLLAYDYVNDLLNGGISIPRNWIVNSQGKWQWEEIGFGDADKWQADMLAKLNVPPPPSPAPKAPPTAPVAPAPASPPH